MVHFERYTYSFDELSTRVSSLIKIGDQIKNRKLCLKEMLEMIDLTTLSGDDRTENVMNLCMKARSFIRPDLGLNGVAAICVYPVFAQLVHKSLENSGIKTACVAGAFPTGLSPLEIRAAEVAYALEQGADEIDMVISRGKMIEGDIDFVFAEISRIKSICGSKHMKVILETGELKSVELIRKASEIALLAGADFLKTSTGKIQPAAQPEPFLIMLDTILEFHQKSGKRVGIKAAGGITEAEQAIMYYQLTKAVLGEKWISKDMFRLGASKLADNLFSEISNNEN